MKFKRLQSSQKQYYSYIKNEQLQLQINILIRSLWYRNISFLFLNKKLLMSILFFSKNNIKNYCFESGRSKNLKKEFWVSRIQLRNISTLRLIPGLKKSSW